MIKPNIARQAIRITLAISAKCNVYYMKSTKILMQDFNMTLMHYSRYY